MGVFEKYVYGIEGDVTLAPANKNKAKQLFSAAGKSNRNFSEGA